jgi:hypothetical protein
MNQLGVLFNNIGNSFETGDGVARNVDTRYATPSLRRGRLVERSKNSFPESNRAIENTDEKAIVGIQAQGEPDDVAPAPWHFPPL